MLFAIADTGKDMEAIATMARVLNDPATKPSRQGTEGTDLPPQGQEVTLKNLQQERRGCDGLSAPRI